jgi:hypothetical protein
MTRASAGSSGAVRLEEIRAALRAQRVACRALGSPFTADVIDALLEPLDSAGSGGAETLDEAGQGGGLARVLEGWSLPPVPAALALRLTGALHALVLDGRAPALARHYPGQDEYSTLPLATAVQDALAEHGDWVRAFIQHPVQTNEVRRSAALLPGLLEIAARTQRPLRLLEIGSSGGLNLLLDRFAYRFGDRGWGPDGSRLRLEPHWSGARPATEAPLQILARRGVDLHPLDFRDDAVVRRGAAYLWPDQPERRQAFLTAVEMLRASEVQVEEGDAAIWLPDVIGTDPQGCCTVVMHSVMWQYMPPEVRRAVEATLRAAGARASAAVPLAWLRFEPVQGDAAFELTLELWPQGSAGRERLARVHPHGAAVHWLAEP